MIRKKKIPGGRWKERNINRERMIIMKKVNHLIGKLKRKNKNDHGDIYRIETKSGGIIA